MVDQNEIKLNENQIEELTTEILHLKEETVLNIMEIGKRLIQIKKTLGHGSFGTYLEKTIDFTQQTANKFMKVYVEFGAANCKATLNLGIEKLFILTKIPKENRKEFIENNDIENISTRQLQQTIKHVKNEHKKAIEIHKTYSNTIIDAEFEDVTYRLIDDAKDTDNLDRAMSEYNELQEKIKQQEVKIRELKENKLMNKKYKDDMSVEFKEVIIQDDFGISMLMYNIYFCKGKTKTKINPEEYGATWFKDINVSDHGDIMVYYINNAKTLIQEEKNFVLSECLKFADQALKRNEEVEEIHESESKKWSEEFTELLTPRISDKDKTIYKKFYKELAKIFHPDKSGTNEDMFVLNHLKEQWGV